MSHEHWVTASRTFSLGELSSALSTRCPGTGTGDVSPAELVAAAELAPHVWARNALVALSAGAEAEAEAGGYSLRLVWERALSVSEKLQVWPDERLLAAARVPYLALHNIQGRREYVCHECGARFEYPNPLKVHLYLGCGPPRPRHFWRALLAALRDRGGAGASAPGAGSGAGGGAARHLCLYCGKAYSRKYGLKIHIRTHTGYRPLRCRYCARAFGDPSNLNKHVRLHTHTHAHAHTRTTRLK